MAEVYGTNDPAFDSVRELLKQRISSGDELGASLCVNIDGKDVLDLWGGYTDVARTKSWDKDTVAPVWSCSKVVTNLAALILIDRGLLDVNENVATYWPEFAANGKENVKVSQILSHTAGLPAWEPPVTIEDTLNWKESTKRLAGQATWWTPGDGSGYHLSSQGYLVGEVVQRVSGKPFKQFVADEITGPLGADFQYGLPEDQKARTVEIIPPGRFSFKDLDPDSIPVKAVIGTPMTAETSMGPVFRKAVSPATNGFSNARALARICSTVSLGGTVDGNKRILKPGSIDELLRQRTDGVDRITFDYVRFGLGVGLGDKRTRPWIPEGDICFWGGWGGSLVLMDRNRRVTIGYVMNNMATTGTLGNPNTEAYVREIYELVNQSLS
ncbi:beta-lactamase domain-containing protein 2 [Penicillium angulare]|uniref:Beta-lactamase domain-containing protein 2 n=1 Tax=Penicillium angulare TaxID=116970 RepID=A0A9W9FBJ3_9EURO|nr:beta-lactamase domain-containing protein 2 [Penicillium angulare]